MYWLDIELDHASFGPFEAKASNLAGVRAGEKLALFTSLYFWYS
jgi:hypothetical protein